MTSDWLLPCLPLKLGTVCVEQQRVGGGGNRLAAFKRGITGGGGAGG